MALPIAGTGLWEEGEARSFRRITLIWMGAMILLVPLLVGLGYFMRMFQSNLLPSTRPEWFYAVLTLHGLGMVGNWFVGGMAGVCYLLTRYVRPSLLVSRLAFFGTAAGLALLVAATMGGLFGAGWYFLYPLPFFSQGVWPDWATACFFVSLAVLGLVWTLWTLDTLRAIAKRYTLSGALAWQYLVGKSEPEVPPIVLITTVSLLSALVGFIAAVIVLVLFGAQALIKGFTNNALMMKNLTFLFGHLLVNITLYLGVGIVYELLPSFNGRPWKTNRVVALAWNCVLAMVLMAYFHHLYMDFAQPRIFQDVGQMMSYFSSVPAAVVSIFGGLALVYASRMRWTIASTFLFLGLMGWAIGGVAAVIDSTVAVNFRFHNTLWVPAHFHTYFLMGVVMMLLGFASYLGVDLSGRPDNPWMRRTIVTLFLVGGYGFAAMFYWAGANSIPRRYAVYPAELASGATDARISLGFVAVLLIAIVLYLWETGKRCLKGFSV